jgi:hypothetical protein
MKCPPARLARLSAAIALAAVLTGCAGAPGPGAGEPTGAVPNAATASAPSPAESGPATDAIRSLNPKSLAWKWFEDHSRSTKVDLTGPDAHGRTYALGKPVYSDADGDGLEDMAVPLAQRDGNGYREHWHIWLAKAAGGAEQVLVPIGLSARCGDATTKVSAVKGGFQVQERLREPIIDDRLPCSSAGTFRSTRQVGVERVGSTHALVNLKDRRGYGGVCPTQPRTETGRVKVWGAVAPTNAAPLTIDGTRMYLIWTHPHELTSGAEPMRLAAVWPAGGNSDKRLCVWTDPGRYESS